MSDPFVTVVCPSCGESFAIPAPPAAELPAEFDYDCEVCCRPMVIVVDGDAGGARAEARGLED